MVRLEPITADNFEECISLTLTERQREFIASNAYSLCEAYALTNHQLYTPMPYAIYHEDKMVGFAMAVYQPKDDDDREDDEDVYYLARIMVDKAYQGRGLGKAALQKMIDLIKTFPHGPATCIVLSSNPQNQPAYSLFKSLGFSEMGIVDSGGDNYLRLDLEA
ncbi:MAG: GNAT family N-acetyltransferase [Bacillota bacterium]|jgi:diamine N-acetyltransferase|nr:GNAT family N-acetyltransferase [Bacillota bacterium]